MISKDSDKRSKKIPARALKNCRKTTIKFIPTEEMISAAMAKCNQLQQELIKFAYETGAQINEAIALEFKDVTDDQVVLYSRKSRDSSRAPRDW